MSDIVLIIVISVIALALVIGLIVGLVKGFTETKTWATEYLFTVVLSVLIYALADTSGMPAWGAAALKLGTAWRSYSCSPCSLRAARRCLKGA